MVLLKISIFIPEQIHALAALRLFILFVPQNFIKEAPGVTIGYTLSTSLITMVFMTQVHKTHHRLAYTIVTYILHTVYGLNACLIIQSLEHEKLMAVLMVCVQATLLGSYGWTLDLRPKDVGEMLEEVVIRAEEGVQDEKIEVEGDDVKNKVE